VWAAGGILTSEAKLKYSNTVQFIDGEENLTKTKKSTEYSIDIETIHSNVNADGNLKINLIVK
jgi:hypothetical protein